MQPKNNASYPKDLNDEIDFVELFNALLNGKWLILSLTSFISILGVIYSLSLPNIYTSEALLVPVSSTTSTSRAFGGYTGLAGLAGISLPTIGNKGNTDKAIEKITSLSFFENNILQNIFLPDLMALKSWNSSANMLIYDENIYKINSNSWVQKPSPQQSFRKFLSHLTLYKDTKSGFIRISIKHQSPYIARQWTDLVINEINDFYRQKDKLESEKAVSYLNLQISKTNLSEIKQVLAQLLQEEIKSLMLIEANEYFVFEYIDPPAVMEKKSEPRRSFICIFIAILGGITSILLALLRHYFFKKKVT